MISRLYAAWLACEAIYSPPANFDSVLAVSPDTVGIVTIDNTLTITIQGTTDVKMWESNFDGVPMIDSVFGKMHTGFLMSARAIYAAVKPLIRQAVAEGKAIAICGHSRGGSLADILSAECALDSIPTSLFLFEAAPVGMQQYVDFCAGQARQNVIDLGISTRNGLDPVPYSDEPFGYIPTWPRLNLEEDPKGLEELNVADWHAGSTIYAGMLRLFPNG